MIIFLLGILGGMGPAATNYLYKLIIKHTPALKDQDHIPTIIYSNTLIPDRTKCILQGKHEEIIDVLSNSAKLLENIGADLVIMPCNTAHYYIEKIQEKINIPIYDMIKITAQYLYDKTFSQINKIKDHEVGLLATTGTIQSRIYQERFQTKNIKVITPNEREQKELMEIIYSIKKSGPSKLFKDSLIEIFSNLRKKEGINWIILGCTELPLLFQDERNIEKDFLVDPMAILAKHVVKKVKGKFVE